MSWIKKAAIALGVVLLVIVVAFIEYNLPSTVLVRITGTDVKRMDTGNETLEGQAITRDVRFIFAKAKKSGKDYVFRNEDTGWGWPPYFKFNSGSLEAKATNIKETEPDATVLVRYYGWRIAMFSMFPNAVSLRVVPDDHSHFPLFNTVFLVVLIGGIGYLVFVIRRRFRR